MREDSVKLILCWIIAMLMIAVVAAGPGIWQVWCAPGRRCMDLGGHYSLWNDTCTIDASLVIQEFSNGPN